MEIIVDKFVAITQFTHINQGQITNFLSKWFNDRWGLCSAQSDSKSRDLYVHVCITHCVTVILMFPS